MRGARRQLALDSLASWIRLHDPQCDRPETRVPGRDRRGDQLGLTLVLEREVDEDVRITLQIEDLAQIPRNVRRGHRITQRQRQHEPERARPRDLQERRPELSLWAFRQWIPTIMCVRLRQRSPEE